MSSLFNQFVYNPIYNALVFLVDYIPGHDMGLAIILVTIIVRMFLYPLSKKAIKAQMAMKEVAPEIEGLKLKYKDDREAQGRAIFALYRERKISPFSGFLVVLVQLPILIGLYFVFALGGLPVVDTNILYSFVHVPESVRMLFMGVFDLSGHSIVLAVLAAVTQFAYTRLSMGKKSTIDTTPIDGSLSAEMAKSFEVQARYVLPIIIGVMGYTIAAAAALYWTVSNIFMIAQELVAGKRY